VLLYYTVLVFLGRHFGVLRADGAGIEGEGFNFDDRTGQGWQQARQDKTRQGKAWVDTLALGSLNSPLRYST
jgi:hypothetical protein